MASPRLPFLALVSGELPALKATETVGLLIRTSGSGPGLPGLMTALLTTTLPMLVMVMTLLGFVDLIGACLRFRACSSLEMWKPLRELLIWDRLQAPFPLRALPQTWIKLSWLRKLEELTPVMRVRSGVFLLHLGVGTAETTVLNSGLRPLPLGRLLLVGRPMEVQLVPVV